MLGTIGIVLAQMGYDVTTTGNYRLMPYQIWRASQDFTPIFLWQPIGGHPIFFNPSAAQFAQWNINVVTETTQGGSFGLAMLLGRQAVTFRDLLGPLLLLPLLCWSPTWFSVRLKMRVAFVAACWIIFFLLFVSWAWFSVLIKAVVLLALLLRWRNANERLPILLVLIGFLATSLPTYYMNVYFAAFTAPLLILVVSGLRHMSQWSKPVGPSLAGFLMLGSAVVPVTQAAALMVGHPLTVPSQPAPRCAGHPSERAGTTCRLRAHGRRCADRTGVSRSGLERCRNRQTEDRMAARSAARLDRHCPALLSGPAALADADGWINRPFHFDPLSVRIAATSGASVGPADTGSRGGAGNRRTRTLILLRCLC
jgi:hypothetical protein